MRRISHSLLPLGMLIGSAIASTNVSAQTATPMDGLWIPNGPVHAIARDANNVYVGGEFSEVNACLPYGIALDHTTAQHLSDHAKPNGLVRAAIADGTGGWFIGGEFQKVGTENRDQIARINADGTLNPWVPSVDILTGSVHALLLSGDTLFVGGTEDIHTYSVSTGVLLSWSPSINGGPVYCMAKQGPVLYFGGQFNTVNGEPRDNLAAVNTSTGFITLWDPGASGVNVQALAINANTIYATGMFNYLGGQARAGLGAVDNVFGIATSWAPGSVGGYALAISNGRLFLGGTFNTLDGQPRQGLASFDAATGVLDAWAPDVDYLVRSITLHDTLLYAGGDFDMVGGVSHPWIAAVHINSGVATPWAPLEMNGSVHAVCAQQGGVYAGGEFTTMGNIARDNLVAFDAITGEPTAWDPDPNSVVRTLDVGNGAVHVGGDFTSIGGQPRANLAAIDVATGLATAWDPGVNGPVHRSFLVGNTLYLSGNFSSVGGQQRVLAGAVDVPTGLATPWNPLPNAEINAFASDGSVIWVGGSFLHFNGTVRQAIAALDPITGLPNAWEQSDITLVSALAVNNNTLYVGGWFQTAWPDVRDNLVAMDATTAAILPWNPSASHWVKCMVLTDNIIYVGGDFTYFGTGPVVDRDHFGAIDATTGEILDWAPGFDENVEVINASLDAVYMGGNFTSVESHVKRSLAGYGIDLSTGSISPDHQSGPDELCVWPNPTNGTCSIILSDRLWDSTIRVRNATGHLLSTQRATGIGGTTIEVGTGPGVYLIEVIAANGERLAQRVVKD
ncbi:MAG: T9SS type A sorting domain-containing protein [Flavobacteriales bacterium]|nr:T9SS type A sorting domain-containing protein [Flavobacteriales bacterium]MBP6697115.1 T9SS type A sorting domain-containing protein [Flavobacteriales bacterium]